ncbi:MAG: class I SAM-dependent methyltransferase [Planctomycetaceae bacterium]|nr:class I SAM-dependent methyltransferase [Planctomycetaceae bacterium]
MALSGITLAESGWVPDALVRRGIRRMLDKRITETNQLPDQTQLAESLSNGPLLVNADEANCQHYEVPPDFFQAVLGDYLKYSCGLWMSENSTLDESEVEMLRLTAERAEISDGMRVLDLGCGWGSMTTWIAKNWPNCQITSVSNSAPQKHFIENRCREQRLDNVTVLTANVADFDTEQRFDRVVSIEMFEHVRNHRLLMSRIARWLEPDGKLFVHVFCHRHAAYLFETEGEENWMGRHFFTGGMMPSADWLTKFDADLRTQERWSVNGNHYARTCDAWLQKLDAKRPQLTQLFRADLGRSDADRQLQRWRIFFMACAELFRYQGGEEWFVEHYRFQRS